MAKENRFSHQHPPTRPAGSLSPMWEPHDADPQTHTAASVHPPRPGRGWAAPAKAGGRSWAFTGSDTQDAVNAPHATVTGPQEQSASSSRRHQLGLSPRVSVRPLTKLVKRRQETNRKTKKNKNQKNSTHCCPTVSGKPGGEDNILKKRGLRDGNPSWQEKGGVN